MAGLLDARAILAYLGVKPFDGTPFYRGVGFVNVGEPIEYPYLETLSGGPILAQPMIMEGEALERLTQTFSRLIIETRDDNRVLRFSNFLRKKSESVHLTARHGFFVPAPASATIASGGAEANAAL
jgi:hypothetical protein